MRKKLLATILSIAMVASCIPMPAMAAGQGGGNPPATEEQGGSSTQPSGQNANNGDGAGQAQKVVQVGNQQYDSIEAALKAPNSDKEITLLGDVTLDKDYTVKKITVPATSTVTINGGHTITGTIENNGTLTLNKVTITSDQATTITNKDTTSKLTIAADATVKNTGDNGTALDAQAGEVTTNGKIESKNGIAVKLDQANVTVEQGEIKGNKYGVHSKSELGGGLSIVAGTISGQTGIYWENPGRVITSDTEDGTAWKKFRIIGEENYGIQALRGEILINGGIISSKKAAIKIENSTSIESENLKFNVAIKDGEFKSEESKSLVIDTGIANDETSQFCIKDGWFYQDIEAGQQTKFISGGYFNEHPKNDWLVEDATVDISAWGLLFDCRYKVNSENKETPEISTQDESIKPTVNNTNNFSNEVIQAAKNIQISGNALSNAVAQYQPSEETKAKLKQELGISDDADTSITIEKEACLDVTPQSYQAEDSENGEIANYKIDLSPSVKIKASIAPTENQSTASSGNENNRRIARAYSQENVGSAEITEPLQVTENAVVKIPLPKGFVNESDQKIYVKHTKESMNRNNIPIQYQHVCDIIRDDQGNPYVMFNNESGFSHFTLTKVPTTVASIERAGVRQYYDNLESAIIDVEDQGTITLEQNIPEETVTVNREVTFTIDKKEFNYKADNIMAGYNLKREVNGNTFIFTYCPPEPDVPIDTVIVEAADNGQVSVDNKKAKEGDKVTVTTMPNENFVVDQIMVTKPGGEPVLTATQTVNQHHFIMPNSPVNVKVTFKAEQPPVGSSFEDVPDDAWFAPAVQYVTSKGIMNGMSETEFAPNTKTNRAMIVTTLYRMENEPAVTASNHFVDVADGQWYTDAIRWASDAGIVSGYDASHFGPTDPITREQLSKILYGYAMSKGYGEAAAISNIDRFDDAVQINSWAKVSMEWANGLGLIQGTSDTMISPQGKALRAQVATILMRFCEDVAK